MRLVRLLVTARVALTWASLGACASLGVASVDPREAAAQPTADALEAARKAYNEGTDAEKAGDCKTAIDRYEEAAAVKESPAVRLRIGRCREKLGLLAAALADYERAQALAAADPAAREVAVQLAAELSNRLPRLKVRVADPPRGLVLTLDGSPLAADGTPERADPGRRVLVARAPGRKPFEQTIELAEGEVRSLSISLEPVDAPPPAPPPEAPPAVVDPPFPWLPVGLYAGGGVAWGVGIPLLLVSLGADADLDERCFDTDGSPSEDRDPCRAPDGSAYGPSERDAFASDREAVNTQQIVGWVLVGAGAAAGGVATVLLLTGDGEEAAAGAGARIERVAPLAGPGLAGLELGGRF